MDQARAQLDETRRQLPTYDKQIQQALNTLSLLTGQTPGSVDGQLLESKPLPHIPGVVDVGVPSTLARRRPDIRQAEANLHAATASVGVAVAAFYPDISLTGNIGMRALDASYLTHWASRFYSAGPSISLPIFSGGQLSYREIRWKDLGQRRRAPEIGHRSRRHGQSAQKKSNRHVRPSKGKAA